MEAIQALFASTLSVFQVEFSIFGFTLSMWDVFLWSAVAGLILSFIGGFFLDD